MIRKSGGRAWGDMEDDMGEEGSSGSSLPPSSRGGPSSPIPMLKFNTWIGEEIRHQRLMERPFPPSDISLYSIQIKTLHLFKNHFEGFPFFQLR